MAVVAVITFASLIVLICCVGLVSAVVDAMLRKLGNTSLPCWFGEHRWGVDGKSAACGRCGLRRDKWVCESCGGAGKRVETLWSNPGDNSGEWYTSETQCTSCYGVGTIDFQQPA